MKEEIADAVVLAKSARDEVMDAELDCDVIESDCVSNEAADCDEIEVVKRNGESNEIEEPQTNGLNLQMIENNSNNSLQRRSDSFRNTTNNFFKAFIAARVKAKSCSPTPSSVAIINNDATPPTSGCIGT